MENQTQKKIEEIARQKQEQQPQKKKGGKGCFTSIVAIALVVVLFTGLVKPGWMKKKPQEFDPGIMTRESLNRLDQKISDKKNETASGKTISTETASMSPEKLTAETKLGVTVRLSEYVLDDETALNVSDKTQIRDDNGEYIICPYSIELGDLHQLSDYITVEIPYDDSFMDKGENAEDCVCGVYYNPETGEWEETLYTVDTAAKKVIIKADHFSDFGAMTIKNKGLRSAYITDYKGVVEKSMELEDSAKSAEILREYVNKKGEKLNKATNSGFQAFMRNEREIAGAVVNTTGDITDAVSNYLSFFYAQELNDVSGSFGYAKDLDFVKIPKGATPEKWERVVNAYARLGLTEPKSVFNDEMLGSIADDFAMLGKILSVYKITMGIIESAKDKDSETILGLYKDCASFALSFISDAGLGMCMSVVYVADQLITSMYKEANGIRYAKIENTYQFYNRKFGGDTINGFRAGRDVKAWRERIIQIIEQNPDTNTSELVKQEIEQFANDYWTIDGVQMGSLLSEMPGDLRNVSEATAKERKKLTKEYIAETYTELIPVMQSVQNYYKTKMEEQIKQSVKKIVSDNNRQIPFVITDMYEGNESDYKGCICKFFPLSKIANEKDWTFTMKGDGCISDKFSFIGYELAGRPYGIAVYEAGADPEKVDPIEFHQLRLDYGNNQVVLNGLEKKEEEKKETVSGNLLKIVDDSIYNIVGVEIYDTDTIYNSSIQVTKNSDLSLDIKIPGETNEHFKDSLYYEGEYYSFSVSGLSFHAKPKSNAKNEWDKYQDYWCEADLTGQKITFTCTHYTNKGASSKRVGTLTFKEGAKVEYAAADGKAYVYTDLPYDMEVTSTLYATSAQGSTDQKTHSSYTGSMCLECYN